MYGLLLLLMIRSLKKSLKFWISPPTTCWSLIWKQTDLKDFSLKICFLICCLNTATTQFNQIRKKTSTPKIESDWGPLQPGWPDWPAYRDEFGLGFIWENSARFPRWEKAEDPGDEFWREFIRKTKQKMAKRNWVITFAPIMALATLLAVSLQLNGLLMMCKIHQAKQNDAIWAALLCDETALLRHRPFNAFIAIAKNSGNRDVVFVWQKFSSPLTDQAALSYEHIENFTKDLEVRRDHGSRASPVNRAHMRGLQIKIETLMKYSKKHKLTSRCLVCFCL